MAARQSIGSGQGVDESSGLKLVRVLEHVAAAGPVELKDVAERAGLPRSTAHRILQQLEAADYVLKVGRGSYRVGPRLRTLAARVTAGDSVDVDGVLSHARDSTGHTIHLGLFSGDELIYVAKLDGKQVYQMASRIGMRLSPHSTAIGKCVLASMPQERLDGMLERIELTARTPSTITNSGDLRRELDVVRARGYALDDEENELNIRCLAVPVHDAHGGPLGGISVTTLSSLTSREELLACAPVLREAATRLTTLLGE